MFRLLAFALLIGIAAAQSGSGSGSGSSYVVQAPEPTAQPTPNPTSHPTALPTSSPTQRAAESLAKATTATQADKENYVAALTSSGHSTVDVLEVDGVINGISCEALDNTAAKNALSAVLLEAYRANGGDSADVVNLNTEICPNKYTGARRRRSKKRRTTTADFSSELVTAGSAAASAATATSNGANAAGVDYSSASAAVGVDTSSVTTSGKTASVPVSAISDTTGVSSFSNLIVNGQEKYDAMVSGHKPSDYGLSWGAICSDVGTESEGCPSWGKFEWCRTGFKFHNANKVDENCSAEGLVVIDGRCYTCS